MLQSRRVGRFTAFNPGPVVAGTTADCAGSVDIADCRFPIADWQSILNRQLEIGNGQSLRPCHASRHCYNAPLDFWYGDIGDIMARQMGKNSNGGNRERREKAEKFQTFNRPKVKVAKTTADGTIFIDYKDTESLKKMISGNGKILSRKRTGATAMEQRMLAKAVKRARYMALLPYVTSAM
jgi:small subunit ribosomal protein S18